MSGCFDDSRDSQTLSLPQLDVLHGHRLETAGAEEKPKKIPRASFLVPDAFWDGRSAHVVTVEHEVPATCVFPCSVEVMVDRLTAGTLGEGEVMEEAEEEQEATAVGVMEEVVVMVEVVMEEEAVEAARVMEVVGGTGAMEAHRERGVEEGWAKMAAIGIFKF